VNTVAKPNPRKPVVVAVVVCDRAIREQETNKWSLIGIFSKIGVNSVPALHMGMAIYLAITNLQEQTRLKLEIAPVNEGGEKLVIEGEIHAKSPLVVAEMVFRFPQFPVTTLGQHRIDVLWQGESIGSTKFDVEKSKP
jgi:hypothetical protein